MNHQPSLIEIKEMTPEKAISFLNIVISEDRDNEEAIILRGMKHWALNHRQEAINDFLTALKINPDGKAKTALELTNSIMDYYNKDLYNP